MKTMTDIKALRELESKATPGPWEWEEYDLRSNSGVLRVAHGVFLGESDGFPGFDDDKEFIVEVRNALPEILDELARLRREGNADFANAVNAKLSHWMEQYRNIEAERDAFKARAEDAEAKLAAVREWCRHYKEDEPGNFVDAADEILAILDAEPPTADERCAQ